MPRLALYWNARLTAWANTPPHRAQNDGWSMQVAWTRLAPPLQMLQVAARCSHHPQARRDWRHVCKAVRGRSKSSFLAATPTPMARFRARDCFGCVRSCQSQKHALIFGHKPNPYGLNPLRVCCGTFITCAKLPVTDAEASTSESESRWQ